MRTGREAGLLAGLRGILAGALALLAGGCGDVRMPEGVQPVAGFEVDRYLGRWHEVARLDHRFERGLTRVTAEYSRRADGAIRVLNRGYDAAAGAWKSAEGTARFVGDPGSGFLKVSFFGPFYGSYVVLDLDREGYRYALVCGPDRGYLWLLSRSPELDAAARERLLAKARALGFRTEDLLWVEQAP